MIAFHGVAPPPRPAARTPPEQVERRVLVVWALLFFNAMTYAVLPTLVHIPSTAGKVLTQGALVVALALALSVNPRALLRPSLFLGLFSVLSITSLMAGIPYLAVGTSYRAVRLATVVAILWLLTPWWGGRTLVLLRAHLEMLTLIVASVAAGAVVAHGAAFSQGGRLSGAIWPIPPTQVAHYAATAAGIVAILWLCRLIERRRALPLLLIAVATLLLSHTRTALVALVVGLIVAGLSLLGSRRRVRRFFMVAVVVLAVVGPVGSPLIRSYLDRGQSSSQITELTGRTKTWSLLLAAPRDTPTTILGEGMTRDGFDGLPIDDSWLATFQDQGLIGDSIDAAVLLSLFVTAAFRPRGPARAVALFLTTYCLLASFTETGLGTSSPYLLDLTVAASLLSGAVDLDPADERPRLL